jgi:hypothetical protein
MIDWIDVRTLRRGKWVTRKTITVATAKIILEKAKKQGLTGMSKVNRGLTKQETYDILGKPLEVLPDDKKLNPLHARNLVREFG